jgi:P pilus assembly chaperone PapD
MKVMEQFRKAGIVCAALVAAAMTAQGATQWSVNPFEVTLADSGRGARQAYQVSNETGKPLEIMVTPYRREVDKEGNDTRGEVADDVFLVIPANIVVPPSGKRTIRVQYVGDPVQQEQAYRLMFEEAKDLRDTPKPDDGKVRTVMNISMRYNSRLFVVPQSERVRPNPVVSEWAKQDGALWLNIDNTGKAHAFLGKYAIAARMDGADEPVYFPLEEDIGILLAGGKREYRLPLPESTKEFRDVGIVLVRN